LGEKGAWAYPGVAEIFKVPLLSQERAKLRTSNLVGVFTASMQIKPLNYLHEKGAWAYPGTAQISSVHIIPGTGKATKFQFCMHVLSIERNKRLLQISGKVAVGYSGLSFNSKALLIAIAVKTARRCCELRYVYTEIYSSIARASLRQHGSCFCHAVALNV